MAKNLSVEVSSFLTSILKNYYGPNIAGVADENGKPPSEDNDYLMKDGGDKFEGVFHDPVKQVSYSFTFLRNKTGWSVKY